MERFKVLEHTADLEIRAYGKDLSELFSNIAKGLFSAIGKGEEKKEGEWEKVSLKSNDQKSLLVDWLNELLYFYSTKNKIYVNFQINELTKKSLKAEIKGVPVKNINFEVKGATYHGLSILKNKFWEATVIFDI